MTDRQRQRQERQRERHRERQRAGGKLRNLKRGRWEKDKGDRERGGGVGGGGSGKRGMERRETERRENFLLQGQPSVLTLISVSVPPSCYRSINDTPAMKGYS